MNDDLLKSSLVKALEKVPILTGHLERIDGTPFEAEKNTDLQVIVGTRGAWYASNHIKGSFQEAKQHGFNHELLDRTFLFKKANDAILEGDNYPLFAVKVNRFDCGSVLLLVTTCHFAADAKSTYEFMRYWGELAQGIDSSEAPFDARHMYTIPESSGDPPKLSDSLQSLNTTPPTITGPICRVRFSIPVAKMAKIKEEINLELKPLDRWVTTDDVMCALGWRALTRARRLGDKVTSFGRMVEIRSMLYPPLPPTAFGNFISYAAPEPMPASELIVAPLSTVAYNIREALKKLDPSKFDIFLGVVHNMKLKPHPFAFDGSVFGINMFASSYTKFLPQKINFHNSPATTMLRAYYKEGALLPQPVYDGTYSCHLGASAEYAEDIINDPELCFLGFTMD
ncbi:hypothetical protein DSO57_1021413 [Entomophthora muscae]|uniref:Uncharacterized protein n=1 Tax=Entomophthora muscae TaxID=34485 RepID=A0ACC2SG44_9FUNG|nr:hypothetical protein DSO57_1021413 [Entomophthora muscae]